MATRRAPQPDTRSRILAAAIEEFGAHGFAATSVDRVARRARVNKAMIYYHFANKRALYTAIVRELFTGIAAKLKAGAAVDAPPEARLARQIETIVESVDASTHFLPILFREIADGAVHLGPDELALIASIFGAVSGVIVEGGRQQVFRPVHPTLAHFTLLGPIVFLRATAPVRARIRKLRHVEIQDADSSSLVAHMQMVARGMLTPATRD
jgi:TetR/AcrR family transcriptional regulator